MANLAQQHQTGFISSSLHSSSAGSKVGYHHAPPHHQAPAPDLGAVSQQPTCGPLRADSVANKQTPKSTSGAWHHITTACRCRNPANTVRVCIRAELPMRTFTPS
ncbi:hypothetical protein ACLOJK_006761, partial [Asimina triloba]